MATPSDSNGSPGDAPTDDGKKLVSKDYASRAAESLGETRHITDQVIRNSLGVFDPNNVTIQDLDRMREDPAIRMGMEYTKGPTIRADYIFESEDARIRAAVQESYDEIHVPFMNVALNMLDYGFQAAVKDFFLGKLESTYEDDEGEQKPVWPDKDVQPVMMGVPIPLPQWSTKVHLKKGKFAGINADLPLPENGRRSAEDDDNIVPPEWSLWFTNRFEDTHRNWYGKARIHAAYMPWYSFWFNWLNRDRHAEMDADPALQVWYPPGKYRGADNELHDNKDLAMEIGNALRGGATIAWPSDVHIGEDGKVTTTRLWDAAFLTGGENLGAYNELLDNLEVAKFRACLVPEQALIPSSNTSSRNSSATYVDIFTQVLEQIAQYLDRIRNKYLIRPFIEANFGKDAATCKIKTTGFQEEDLTLATALIEAAFTADPNALPINFEELLKGSNLPVYTKKEQQEREDAIAQQQADQQAAADAAAAAGTGDVGALPGEAPGAVPAAPVAPGAPLNASQRHLHLHGKSVASTAPGWARREGARRDRNVAAVGERLDELAQNLYRDAFAAAAEAVFNEEDLTLSVASTVGTLVGKIRSLVSKRLSTYQEAATGELASVYHASGMAELTRLGLATESWDVGRDEVQEWARWRAGELVKTIEETVVERHVRPFLASELQKLSNGPDFIEQQQGIPIALDLAQKLSDRFAGYPLWMAQRLVRTEARMGYNESAADMWERVGVIEVQEFDGLGGKTGKTDEECLRRNGETVNLDQFRQDNREEHPNGTLGAIPVTVGATLVPLKPGVLSGAALMSGSIYAITDAGLILSQAEVGRAMAEA